MSRIDAVVTGGGTSGHVLPALSVLELLEDAGIATSRLAYVGCRRGVERQLLVSTPYVVRFLPIAGLQRHLSVRSFVRNVLLPFRVAVSYTIAVFVALRWRPRVVVSVGGYASAPMSFAARIVRVPLVCVSYDAIPGLATRRQARHAALCATAFPDSALPRAVHTGAPVRREIRSVDVARMRESARHALDIPADHVLVVVMGGSQGSAVLNAAVQAMLVAVSGVDQPVAVLHVCGERFLQAPLPQVPAGVWYRRVGYETRMAELLAATDVLVCRAGAGTIAEISTVGIASVIVPWKDSAEDHQRRNAAWLGDAGGAVIIDEASVDADLADEVALLVRNVARRLEIATRARERGEMNRHGALASAIQSVFTPGSHQST